MLFPEIKRGKSKVMITKTCRCPIRFIEMGLLPETSFVILHQAPFMVPLYIEYGEEKRELPFGKKKRDLFS